MSERPSLDELRRASGVPTTEERCPSCGGDRIPLEGTAPLCFDLWHPGRRLTTQEPHEIERSQERAATTEDSTFREDAEYLRSFVNNEFLGPDGKGRTWSPDELNAALDRILASYESMKRRLATHEALAERYGVRDLADKYEAAIAQLESMKKERDDSRSAQVTLRDALNGYRARLSRYEEALSYIAGFIGLDQDHRVRDIAHRALSEGSSEGKG